MINQCSKNNGSLAEFIPMNQMPRLFESIVDPMYLVDKDLRIIYANEALIQKLKSLNLSPRVINKKILDVYPFLSNNMIEEYIQVFQSGETLISKGISQIGGKISYAEIRKVPIFINGEIKYIMTSVRDNPSPRIVQEDKNISEIENNSKNHRERFIEITTHELRTPLTNIKGFIEILSRYEQKINQEKKKSIFKVLEKNIKRLELLINDVSNVSKIDQDNFRLDKKEVKFGFFLFEEMLSYKRLLGDLFDYKLRPTNHELFPILSLDEDRIHQVFNNIINNAIKQSPKEALKISVQATLLPEHVRIRFMDNGIGIATENLEKIFEHFVSIPTRLSVTGTGIGLYLSRMIIEKHGGTIKAKSEGLDQGASFIIDLPIYNKVL